MTEEHRIGTRPTVVAIYVAAIGSIIFASLIVWALIRGGPDHDDLLRRIEELEESQRTAICLLQLPLEARGEGVDACVPDEILPP